MGTHSQRHYEQRQIVYSENGWQWRTVENCMAKWYFCAASQCRRKKQNEQDDQAKPINISHWPRTNDETHTHVKTVKKHRRNLKSKTEQSKKEKSYSRKTQQRQLTQKKRALENAQRCTVQLWHYSTTVLFALTHTDTNASRGRCKPSSKLDLCVPNRWSGLDSLCDGARVFFFFLFLSNRPMQPASLVSSFT